MAILCAVIDRPDLQDDVRFANNDARVANRQALLETLGQIFLQREADHWLDQMRDAGLPCGPINTVADVFAHPQGEARGLQLLAEHPTAGAVRMPGFPYELSKRIDEAGSPGEVMDIGVAWSVAQAEALMARHVP